MATTLDLSNAPLQDSTTHIQHFFTNNTWTYGHYHEDQIILDAMHADFLPMLDSLAAAINQVKDVRGALHIHLHNIEKANTPLLPLLSFHNSIIDQHHLFDGYNLYVFAHGDDSRSVNIGTLALSL
jgi:diadenosine tetraphosphatase ApaH/serine/threonine PP2A family protein phosphatase